MFVYLIRFSSGTVKVGQTKDFGRRLTEHTKNARCHGVTVEETWHALVDDADVAERYLLGMAGGHPVDGNPEFIIGANFPAILKHAENRFGSFAAQMAEHERRIAVLPGEPDPWVNSKKPRGRNAA